MNRIRFPVRASAVGVLVSVLACRPIFVIGLGEWAILVLVILLLLGPVFFRFWRTWSSRNRKKD